MAFLAQPSVSTTGQGIEDMVVYLTRELDGLGFATRVLTLPGAYPLIHAEAGPPAADVHLTVYGHYDVQAPDPLELWHSDPFQPEIRDGKIFARGATDDKGNLFANIKAAEALKTLLGQLPIRLTFFFEGEEEIGSPNLRAYLKEYADLFRADATILCDRGVHESGRPQIYLGDKGLVSVRLRSFGAARDVHSGHAPLIPSAAWNLIRLLGRIKGPDDRILIPEYYEDVEPPTEEELALLAGVPFDPEQFKARYGIDRILVNGSPLDQLRALVFEPTANVSGLIGGWTGAKPKTIVPAQAEAVMDFRLVKRQSCDAAAEKIRRFVDSRTEGRFEMEAHPHFEEYRCPPGDPWARLAVSSAREATGAEPVVWPLLDGSGPLCWFNRYLGGPTFIIGLGAPFETANTHAPNENIGLDHYLTGIVQMALLMYRAQEVKA
jgi:acetylornithine deacetylase/succinyl-diaminopimelate desuccinylase-like protein